MSPSRDGAASDREPLAKPLPRPPFAYAFDGALLVTSDGPEVLVHRGEDEAPLFRHALGAPCVGLAVTEGAVVAVAADGTLTALDRETGEPTRTVALERLASALAAAPGGLVAVLGASSVNLVRAHGEKLRLEIDVEGPTAVAVDAEGRRVAVSTKGGSVRVFDAASGDALGAVSLPGEVHALAWSPRGYWIASTARGLAFVAARADRQRFLLDSGDLELGPLAVSQDGALAAVRVGGSRVLLVDLLDFDTHGTIAFERAVGDLAFGPGAWLGVGLDLGDANKIHLATGDVHRTDPHPGRKRNAWLVASNPKSETLSKARERARLDPGAFGWERAPTRGDAAHRDTLAPAAGKPVNGFAVFALLLLAIGILVRVLAK